LKDTDEEFVGRVPLFDRLLDKPPPPGKGGEPLEPYRALTGVELCASVGRELQRLVETRSRLRYDALLRVEPIQRSVIDYGLPDFGWMNAGGPQAQRRLAAALARTVVAFEPRLKEVNVTIDGFLRALNRLRVNINGVLQIGEYREPISFPLLIPLDPVPADDR